MAICSGRAAADGGVGQAHVIAGAASWAVGVARRQTVVVVTNGCRLLAAAVQPELPQEVTAASTSRTMGMVLGLQRGSLGRIIAPWASTSPNS